MPAQLDCALVGVDWGTTHRRLYALDGRGRQLGMVADEDGAALCRGRFAQALASGLRSLQARPDRVVVSGMAGSTVGWQVAPYVDSTVALTDLAHHLVAVQDATAPVPTWIVPGYCIRNDLGQPDVMRGEEMQLLGALTLGHHTGVFILPGTHSKWVELVAGRIVRLRTYMTGELFAVLSRHGTLAAAVAVAVPVWDASAFEEGVGAARHGALGHQLFGCRARVVCGDMSASSAQAYLSGLLIGSELQDVLNSPLQPVQRGRIKLIGSPDLARHYQTAAAMAGCEMEVIDADVAYRGAMAHIQAQGRFV